MVPSLRPKNRPTPASRPNQISSFGKQAAHAAVGGGTTQSAPQLYQMLQQGGPGGHTQLVPVSKGLEQRSRLSIPGNRVSSGGGGGAGAAAVGGGLQPATQAGHKESGKGTFVICEICDGYIKDLEQLRTHMQWIHKVKIHPKMLASRPPLNCQRCQWRFFTDQGLERHLLGAHGLVTSNMQDMVNQGSDGGRCTVCGRILINKLVAHMNQVSQACTAAPADCSLSIPGAQDHPEAGTLVLQVHRLLSHLQPVPPVREPRVHGALRIRQEVGSR